MSTNVENESVEDFQNRVKTFLNNITEDMVEKLDQGRIVIEGEHVTVFNDFRQNRSTTSQLQHKAVEGLYFWAYAYMRFTEEGKEYTKPKTLSGFHCKHCGQSIQYTCVEENGQGKLIPTQEDCYGVRDFDFTIDVPSGELIVCDSLLQRQATLEPFYNLNQDENGKSVFVSNTRGKHIITLNNAAIQILHVFASDTSPMVYKHENSLSFVRADYDYDTDEIIHPEGYTPVGQVCTDLWWVTAVDSQVYRSLLVEALGEEEGSKQYHAQMNSDSFTVKVTPGQYRVHVPYVDDYDADTFTCATMTLIKEKSHGDLNIPDFMVSPTMRENLER